MKLGVTQEKHFCKKKYCVVFTFYPFPTYSPGPKTKAALTKN